jgi:hypothetical protein
MNEDLINTDDNYFRRFFPVSTPYVDDSGTDLLGLDDYSQYKINEDRDYSVNWGDFFSSLGTKVAGAGKGLLDTVLNPSGSGLLALIAALAASNDRRPAYGGGTRMAMPVVPRRAAMGGMMQSYAQGGPVRMEDGGFVLTERAVQGAGGPRGLAAVLPQARMIRGPGNGTSDSIPATISGPKGQTPARVSNGEAYVPRSAVQQAGGPKRMYGLMSALERRA